MRSAPMDLLISGDNDDSSSNAISSMGRPRDIICQSSTLHSQFPSLSLNKRFPHQKSACTIGAGSTGLSNVSSKDGARAHSAETAAASSVQSERPRRNSSSCGRPLLISRRYPAAALSHGNRKSNNSSKAPCLSRSARDSAWSLAAVNTAARARSSVNPSAKLADS